VDIMTGWPQAQLDGVRRLHVMAAAVRGATVAERLVEAPFAQVWQLLQDLEGSFGEILPDMRHVQILRREGSQVEALARSRYGMRALLRGELSEGYCWLQSRFVLIGVAARAEGAGTRVAITGGVRVPGRAAIVPVGVRRETARALDRLQDLIAGD
jgi:hypothetical protein